MNPIVVHFQPVAALTVDAATPGFEDAVRSSGGEPICGWVLGRSGFAVIDDPTQQALQFVADQAPVSVVQAARLEIYTGLPAGKGFAGLVEALPNMLHQPIVFASPPRSPLLSIPPQDPPLVACWCEDGIHPPPRCPQR